MENTHEGFKITEDGAFVECTEGGFMTVPEDHIVQPIDIDFALVSQDFAGAGAPDTILIAGGGVALMLPVAWLSVMKDFCDHATESLEAWAKAGDS